MGYMKNACDIFYRKTEKERPPGRPRHRCEDSIRTDLRGIGSKCVDWINLGHYRYQWREKHRLRVFENHVLRRIFGPKRDEVTR
jgi:hypothetical protein